MSEDEKVDSDRDEYVEWYDARFEFLLSIVWISDTSPYFGLICLNKSIHNENADSKKLIKLSGFSQFWK